MAGAMSSIQSVINLKSAKALDPVISLSLLGRPDKLIE
jgi:hypothetical protein